jgi:hypothetical protein
MGPTGAARLVVKNVARCQSASGLAVRQGLTVVSHIGKCRPHGTLASAVTPTEVMHHCRHVSTVEMIDQCIDDVTDGGEGLKCGGDPVEQAGAEGIECHAPASR